MQTLLCTATNETPHNRFLRFPCQSSYGSTLPDYLLKQGSPILHKRHSVLKGDPVIEKVTLQETISPYFARIQYNDGRCDTVSTRTLSSYVSPPESKDATEVEAAETNKTPSATDDGDHLPSSNLKEEPVSQNEGETVALDQEEPLTYTTRSERRAIPPDRFI